MEAYNGQEAVQLVEKCLAMTCNLRLIFMDIQMPIRDGISASEEVHFYYQTVDDKVFYYAF
jgi:CheY-like chemotaxis protein